MPLSFEQFKALRSQGLSVDQITRFEAGQKPKADVSGHAFNPNNADSQFTQPTPTGASQMQYKPEDKTGVAGKFVKELPGAAVKTVGGLAAKTAVSLGEIAAHPVKTLKGEATGKTYNLPLLGPTKSIQTEAKQGFDAFREGKINLLQAVAPPITDSILGPLDVGMAAKGITKLPSLISKLDVRAGGAAAEQALKKAEQSSVKTTWQKIQPKLKTEADIAEAAKGGQLEKTALGGVKQAVPTAGRNLEMTKVAAPYVDGAKDELQMVKNMQRGIEESANSARQGLQQSKAIWNVNELKGKINQIEIPISVKSDATLSNAFKNVQAKVVKLAEEAPRTPDGLLDIRQQLDRIMEDDFGPRIWDRSDGVSKIYKAFRTALNDLADSKVADGALKAELKKQSLLYDAIDNVAPKIKLGNPFVQFAKNNPKTATAAGTAASFLTGGAILKKLGIGN